MVNTILDNIYENDELSTELNNNDFFYQNI